jgi:hypothetical protein
MTLTRLEQRVFATIVDYAVAPAEPLPACGATDAIAAFERYVNASPTVNRAGLRGALVALELVPLVLGRRKSLTRLAVGDRDAVLNRLLHGRISGLIEALRAMAHLCYYGDLQALHTLGYDPEAVVARGRALRSAEGRW